MNNIYYSTDKENFNHADIRDAADELFSKDQSKPGDTGIIYSGDAVRSQASDFISSLDDNFCNIKNVKEIKVEKLDDEMDFYRVIEGS